MKNILRTFALIAVVALFATACGTGSDGSGNERVVENVDNADNTSGATDERIETFWVGPQLVECIGEATQMCMQIRRTEDGQVEWFYDSIDGFEHEVGTSYVLRVAVSDVENPPADASSLSYRLVEVVESSSESATVDLDGTSWVLLGFRDGDLFDPVPEGIEISAAFDGDRIGGSSGCNTYGGSFTADGDAITFGPLMGTRMACEPDRMDQEQRFLSILETVDSAEMTFDERLVLKPASGLTLVFAPAD